MSAMVTPEFFPLLTFEDLGKWKSVEFLIKSFHKRHDSNPFMIIFMGGVPKSSNHTPLALGTPPYDHYDNDHSLYPLCAMSTLVGLTYVSCGIRVYLYKIPYDAKPKWYTTMADVETWNNKGEFPGAYLSVEGIDESWITDSAVLMEKIKGSPLYKKIEVVPEGLDEEIWSANMFFSFLPAMKNSTTDDIPDIMDEKFFAPMNEYLANTCKTKFLAADTPTIADCKWAYFAMMSNMLGLFFTGRSLIKREHTALYEYLERFSKSSAIEAVQGYQVVPPSRNCSLLNEKLSKFGFDRKPLIVNCPDIPLDCLWSYYQIEEDRESAAALAKLKQEREKAKGGVSGPTLMEVMESSGLAKFADKLKENEVNDISSALELEEEDLTDEEIGMKKLQAKRFLREVKKVKEENSGNPCKDGPELPEFEPKLKGNEQARFDQVSDLIWSLSQSSEPYLVLFMGSYKRPEATFECCTPPSDYFDNDETLIPGCGMSTMVHLAYTAAGVNVKMIKIDYDDKPNWYTQMIGQEEWNNKGQFPGAFVMCPDGNGKWVTDSGILLEILVKDFPQAEAVSKYPEGLDESVLGPPNLFFKAFTWIKGEDEECRSRLDFEIFKPIEEWFAAEPSKRLYLAGEKFGIEDAKFFYFTYLVNAMGYVFEASSFIDRSHTHLYGYMRRCCENEIYHQATGYFDISPGFHIKLMVGKFKSMGMNMHEEKVMAGDIPEFAGFRYCEASVHKDEWGRVEVAKIDNGHNNGGMANDQDQQSLQDFLVSLSLEIFYQSLFDNDVKTKDELSKLEDEDLMDEEIGMRKLQVNKLRRAMRKVEGGVPAVVQTPAPDSASPTVAPTPTASVRVVKKKPKKRRNSSNNPHSFKQLTFTISLPPSELRRFEEVKNFILELDRRHGSNYCLIFIGSVLKSSMRGKLFKNGSAPADHPDPKPDLTGLCSISATTALKYLSANVPTYFYKIDYDDKPLWFTSIANIEDWNNKGQFPSAYVSGTWKTDSANISAALPVDFPHAYASAAPSVHFPDIEKIATRACSLFMEFFPHILGKADLTESLDAEIFQPLDAHLTSTGYTYLGGEAFSNLDVCGLMMGITNSFTLFLDGKSLIKKERTHLYRFLRTFSTSPHHQTALEYLHVNPSTYVAKVLTTLKDKMGLEPKPAKASLDTLPLDSNWRYYEFYTPPQKTILPPPPSNLFPGITFSPPLSNTANAKFQDVQNLIHDLRQRYTEGDFAVLFIGGLAREKYGGIQTTTPSCPPSQHTYSRGPSFIPVCAFTTLSCLYLQSTGVAVSYFTVPYDDKDEWYSSMQGMPNWNNKGTFPGAYFGGEFIMESENILEAIKEKRPAAWKSIEGGPAGLDEDLWKSNILFKMIPHINGGADCRAKVNDEVFSQVNEFLKRNRNRKFLCGDTLGQADIEFAYLTAMCNMIGLLWDGRSLIDEEFVELRDYLERFMMLDDMSRASNHEWVAPSCNLKKLIVSLEKIGMTLGRRAIEPFEVPIDAAISYYEIAAGEGEIGWRGLAEEGGGGEEKKEEKPIQKEAPAPIPAPAPASAPAPAPAPVLTPVSVPVQQPIMVQAASPAPRLEVQQDPYRSPPTVAQTPEESTDKFFEDTPGKSPSWRRLSFKTRLINKIRLKGNAQIYLKEAEEGDDKEDISFPRRDSAVKKSGRPQIDKESLKSRNKRSTDVNWSKNWYWMLLDSTWKELGFVVIGVYSMSAVFLALLTIPYFHEIQGTDSPEVEHLGKFEISFVFIVTNLLSIGLGTFEPSGRWTQAITVVSYFAGLIINVLLFSIVVTKFQRPQAEIVFSECALFTSRDNVPYWVFRLGNMRGNLLYFPKVIITVQTPITTSEGESMMKMQEIKLFNIPSTVTGSVTLAHKIDEKSPLRTIISRAKYEMLDDDEFIFSVAFSAFDSTFHSDIVSSKKYFVKDLRFGERFGDIMQSKGGFAFVNWDNFNTYKEVECDKAYRSLAALGRKCPLTVKRPAITSKQQQQQQQLSQLEEDRGEKEDTSSNTTEEELEPDVGILLSSFTYDPPKFKAGTVVFFPNSTTLTSGETLPTCTFTLSTSMAFVSCKVQVKFNGVSVDSPPPWFERVSWQSVVIPDGSNINLVRKSPNTPSHGGRMRAASYTSEAMKTKQVSSVLCAVDGSWHRGAESILAVLAQMRPTEWSKFSESAPHFEYLMELHFSLILSINKYVRLEDNQGSMDRNKKDLKESLLNFNEHLEMNGGGKKFLVHDNELHLLDCLLGPLLHRCSCLFGYFEGTPIGGRALNEYLTKICCSETWISCVKTREAGKTNLAYLETMRMILGKKIRPKKRRASASICI